MKNESRSLWCAEVDSLNVKFSKAPSMGIEFYNEIDGWSKMKFKFQHQIQQLRKSGSAREEIKTSRSASFSSLRYSIQEKLE